MAHMAEKYQSSNMSLQAKRKFGVGATFPCDKQFLSSDIGQKSFPKKPCFTF